MSTTRLACCARHLAEVEAGVFYMCHVWAQALKAYEEALSYSPENKVARSRAESLRTKVGRINMTS